MVPKSFIYIIVISVGFLIGYIKYLERCGIYYPVKEIEFTPKDIGLAFEDVYIKTQDNLTVNGWFIPNTDAKFIVLFLHGNAGNISNRLDKIQLLRTTGADIFIIDYRGYGKSQGIPTEHGLYRDAGAAYDYLVRKRGFLPEQIVLYGESIGSAAVVDLAAKEKIAAIIIEGGFSCGKDMAKRIYPFIPAFIFSNTFDSIAKIKRITAPKLFLHSKDDEVIPFDLAKKLYDAADEPKRFAELMGDHNSAFLNSQQLYLSSLTLFLKDLDTLNKR